MHFMHSYQVCLIRHLLSVDSRRILQPGLLPVHAMSGRNSSRGREFRQHRSSSLGIKCRILPTYQPLLPKKQWNSPGSSNLLAIIAILVEVLLEDLQRLWIIAKLSVVEEISFPLLMNYVAVNSLHGFPKIRSHQHPKVLFNSQMTRNSHVN